MSAQSISVSSQVTVKDCLEERRWSVTSCVVRRYRWVALYERTNLSDSIVLSYRIDQKSVAKLL